MALKEQHRKVLEDADQSSRKSLQWLLSVLIAVLPRTWRRGLEEGLGLHPERVGVASSILQTGVFLLLWGLGLAAYMVATPMSDADTFDDTIVVFFNPALPLVYLLTTLRGSLTALGALGGLIRLFSAVSNQGSLADPTLSLIEALRCKVLRGIAGRARERAKGERSRDVITHAQGHEPWDLRIVSCDRYDWHVGAGVKALGTAWAVVAVEDITDAQGRLRVAHDLRKPEGAEAVRGYNSYQPPEPPRVVGEARERDQPQVVEERASIPLSPQDPDRSR